MARKRGTRARTRRPAARAARRRGPWWLVGALAAVTLAGVAWWRLSATRPPPRFDGGGLGLDPQEADQAGLSLGKAGRHIESIPYFREVARQDPRSAIAHENLASALGNAAQEARTHLGKTDNAIRSSVERIAMIKEAFGETENARQLGQTNEERVLALLEQGRLLYTWGFPMDALARMRAAAIIAPRQPVVLKSVQTLERELVTGER